jgi:integrase
MNDPSVFSRLFPVYFLGVLRLTTAQSRPSQGGILRTTVTALVAVFTALFVTSSATADPSAAPFETITGTVAAGQLQYFSGQRMHKARHTAGQRVLDATGNLKAVQKLLGHSSIQTTGDIYADWDIDQLAHTMAQVLSQDDV